MTDDAFDESLRQANARVGSTLKGKWTLDYLLGVGGMASVYAATHRNQKRVAIKMLHPELSFNASVRQRFLREGYVANTVQHPGAVSVFDDELSDDGCAFLVMELLDGETLDARWQRKGKRLPVSEVLALMDRVLDTLAAAHARGIVHRDLKPENLFFTREAAVKVLDFGIARVRELSGASKTQTGSLMGTPTFMPPEQARGRWDEVDAQSDLWAVGATMFTLLTGRFVHDAGTVNEALVLAVTQPATSLGVVRPDLPDEVVQFVDRSLAYKKQSRWPDALAMQTALREAYAALESNWDEHTVLTDAAASLPDGPVKTSGGVGATALVTSMSAHPSALKPRPRVLLIGAAAALVALVLLLVLWGRGERPALTGSEVPRAAAVVQQAAPTSVPIAVAPASPPPLSISDLPAAEHEKRKPSAVASSVHAVAAPTPVATQSPVLSASTSPKPKAGAVTDPFAGRE